MIQIETEVYIMAGFLTTAGVCLDWLVRPMNFDKVCNKFEKANYNSVEAQTSETVNRVVKANSIQHLKRPKRGESRRHLADTIVFAALVAMLIDVILQAGHGPDQRLKWTLDLIYCAIIYLAYTTLMRHYDTDIAKCKLDSFLCSQAIQNRAQQLTFFAAGNDGFEPKLREQDKEWSENLEPLSANSPSWNAHLQLKLDELRRDHEEALEYAKRTEKLSNIVVAIIAILAWPIGYVFISPHLPH